MVKSMHGTDIIKKVVAISGDVMQPNLGVSEEDSDLLHKSVNIMYHCAATIRFDEPLKSAVLLNTRGTKYALEFAQKMTKLEVLLNPSVSKIQGNSFSNHCKSYSLSTLFAVLHVHIDSLLPLE